MNNTNCSNCKEDLKDCKSKALEQCGHFICYDCLKEFHQHQYISKASTITFTCQICGTINTLRPQCMEEIYFYTEEPKSDPIKNYTTAPTGTNSVDITELSIKYYDVTENIKPFCLLHSKEMDAYCNTDNKLICINCILEGDHKTHELLTLKKGYEEVKKAIDKGYEKMGQTEKLIETTKVIIKEFKDKLIELSEQRISKITKYFQRIREILNDRENTLLKRINSTFSNEISKFEVFQSGLDKQKAIINYFSKNKSKLFNERNEVELLYDSKEALNKIELANISIPRIDALRDDLLFNLNPNEEYENLIFILSKKLKGAVSEIDLVNIENPGITMNSESYTMNSTNGGISRKINKGYSTKNASIKDLNKHLVMPEEAKLNIESNNYFKIGEKLNNMLSTHLYTKQISLDNPISLHLEEIEKEEKDLKKLSLNNKNSIQSSISPKLKQPAAISKLTTTERDKINFINSKKSEGSLDAFDQMTSKNRDKERSHSSKSKSNIPSSSLNKTPKINSTLKKLNKPLKTPTAIESKIPKKSRSINKSNGSTTNIKLINRIESIEINEHLGNSNQVESEFNYEPETTIANPQHLDDTINISRFDMERVATSFIDDASINLMLNPNQTNSAGMLDSSSCLPKIEELVGASIFKSFRNSVYIFGGTPDKTTLKFEVEKNKWTEIKTATTTRIDFCAVQYKSKILLVGGKENNDKFLQTYDVITMFDTIEGSYKCISTKLKSPKLSLGSVYLDSKLYAAGGTNGKEVYDTLEYFDKQINKWIQLSSMNYKRKDFPMILAFDNCIYSLGGADEKE